MRKNTLLALSIAVLATAAGCNKEEPLSKDAGLEGVNVTEGDAGSGHAKLFVLNEGNYQKNNSTLDFFRFKDGNYVTDAFSSMNPTVTQGLGDTGNDIALDDGRLWIVMNGSGMVHVLDAKDESLIATVKVPDPRFIAFGKDYAYVSSYAGAVYGGEETKGKVFRVDRRKFTVEGSVEVGCQPEGIAVSGGTVWVANSGGYNYVHENTVSMIDEASFKVKGAVDVASNLHLLGSDRDGRIWVTSYGVSTWNQDASGNWVQEMSEPMGLFKVTGNGSETIAGVHASIMTCCDDGSVYTIGNASEMSGGFDNTLYKVDASTGAVKAVSLSGTDASKVSNPYGIAVNPDNGDIFIADAPYTGPGKVWCFTKDLTLRWSAVAGMLPAHMVLY